MSIILYIKIIIIKKNNEIKIVFLMIVCTINGYITH